jgi:hypothetical protein
VSHDNDALNQAYHRYQTALLNAGLLIPSGVPGVYGLSGVFEHVVEQFEAFITRAEDTSSGGHALSAAAQPVLKRCRPITWTPSAADGSLHTFMGDTTDHAELTEKGWRIDRSIAANRG